MSINQILMQNPLILAQCRHRSFVDTKAMRAMGLIKMDFQGFKYDLTSSDSETDIGDFYT